MSTYQIIGLSFAAIGILSLIILIVEQRNKRSNLLSSLPVTHIMIRLISILVGGLFIYSGFIKANDYTGFAYKLEEYFVVFGTDFMKPLAFPLAWFISVFEIALGVAIILGFMMQITSWLAVLMMIFFTILTGYSHFTGAVTDCGCFGDALKIAPWESFTKDIILTGMLIPLFIFRKQIQAIPNNNVAGWATLGVFILSGIFASYCRANLPLIDYRPYKVQVNLERCTTEMGPEGLPACKDWAMFFLSEEIDVFKGNVLMIIMHNLNHTSPSELENSIRLSQELSDSDITVLATTATGRSDIESLDATYNFPYEFALMDETVLKTIVRSNPGYMLIKDGIIIKKWHYNNISSKEELSRLMSNK